MPAYEDENGTYIMNSKDLRAVQHVQTLMQMGIDCLKIEGRTKSHYYTARTTRVYRQAIDDAMADKPFDMRLMDELEGLANRGYTEGFYRRHPPAEYQNYERGFSRSDRQQFVGEALDYDARQGLLRVAVKNRFGVGDKLELMTPAGNLVWPLNQLLDAKGHATDVAPGSGHEVLIPLELTVAQQESVEFGLLAKHLPLVETAA